MRTIRQIDAERKALEEQITELNAEECGWIKRRVITCGHCTKKATLGRWKFVQETHKEDGERFHNELKHCSIVCPNCGRDNHIEYHSDKLTIMRLIGRAMPNQEQIFPDMLIDEGGTRRSTLHTVQA